MDRYVKHNNLDMLIVDNPVRSGEHGMCDGHKCSEALAARRETGFEVLE
jgi:hypothetical protein